MFLLKAVMTPNELDELRNLIDQLIAYGEDADELNVCLALAPNLDDESFNELVTNLKKELLALKA